MSKNINKHIVNSKTKRYNYNDDKAFTEYSNLSEIRLIVSEYAQIAHIINSKKNIICKRNIIYSELYAYKVYWLKYDVWKIYGKTIIEESEDVYNERNEIKNS